MAMDARQRWMASKVSQAPVEVLSDYGCRHPPHPHIFVVIALVPAALRGRAFMPDSWPRVLVTKRT